MASRALVLCLCLLFSSLAAGQSKVWVVDASGGAGHDFLTIDAAVQAASSGDGVLVRSGSYGPFPIDGKALSVVAEVGHDVSVSAWSPFGLQSIVRNTPAGSSTMLRGLDFVAPIIAPGSYTSHCLAIDDCQGTVWLEDCTFTDGTFGAVLVFDSQDVALERCTSIGSNGFFATQGSKPSSAALRIENSNVHVHGGSYTGGIGRAGGLPHGRAGNGFAGILFEGGELLLSLASVRGGDGGQADPFFPCDPPGEGGPGLWTTQGTARLASANLVGGNAGGSTQGCGPGADGDPWIASGGTVTTLGGNQASLATNAAWREGQVMTLDVAARPGPGLTAVVLASPGTEPVFLAGLFGVSLPSLPRRTFLAGAIDPQTGLASFQFPVSELGPQVEFQRWFLQVVVCGPQGCTLGGASSTLLLDSSF